MKKRELLILLTILVIDIASKYAMESILVLGDSMPVIDGFFYLSMVHNTGGAWGILSGKLEIFFIITLAVLVVIIYLLTTSANRSKLFRYALTIILAGTLGNFFDRVVFGYVRDFLHFYPFGYDFPVFNIADIALCFGYFLLAIHLIKDPEAF